MDSKTERLQLFPLATGMIMGCLSSPDIKQYLLDREVTEGEIEAAYQAIRTIAKAFYKEPK